MSAKNEGLGLFYRIRWRLTWLLLHVAGPPTLSDAQDPRRQMERQRAAKVAAARRAREQREAQVHGASQT